MSVVERVLEALNAGDVEAFVACYAEDATIEDGYDRVGVRGHDELRARYQAMFDRYPGLRVEPLAPPIEAGEFVIQHERVIGRGDHTEHVAVYLVQDDRIARERLLA